MLILTIRTDKPEAEIGLYADEHQDAYEMWQAHRALAETIHDKVTALLHAHDHALADIQGIVFYKGPGSFTGLRIGASVVNALGYSLSIPVIGASGETWQVEGVRKLLAGQYDTLALPVYDRPAATTAPKK